MAGRNQHYIPQAVQRAFEAKRTGKHPHVYVYRKGKPVYLVPVTRSGAERDFYSNPLKDGDGALDDKITEFESRHLGRMLNELRSFDSGEVDAELAAVVVVHLAIRTAHLRSSMAEMAEVVVEQVQIAFATGESARKLAGVDSVGGDPTFSSFVADEISRLGLDDWPEKDRKTLERIVSFRLRERFDDLVDFAQDAIKGSASTMVQAVPVSVTEAHVRALSSSVVPEARLAPLRQLHWKVVSIEDRDGHLILPDCVALGATSISDELGPLGLLAAEDVQKVVMPLSPRQLLIGYNSDPQIELSTIAMQLARCSRDFFVSSRCDRQADSIALSIGAWSMTMPDSLLAECEYGAGVALPVQACMSRAPQTRVPMGKRGNVMRKALLELARRSIGASAVERIEAITVPADLSAALQAAWNRVPSQIELNGAALGTVELVKRRGDWRCHVIVPRNVATALVEEMESGNQKTATWATRVSLGRVVYFDCWANQCPQLFEASETDVWSQISVRASARSASFFFGGFTAAAGGEGRLPGEKDHPTLAQAIHAGILELRMARRNFFAHRSIDTLLLDAVRAVELIQVPLATAHGYLHGLKSSISIDSSAGRLLSSVGLWEWSMLFQRDLRGHYGRRHCWVDRSELTQLRGHIERLLWTVGVVVSKVEGGHWVDIVDDQNICRFETLLTS